MSEGQEHVTDPESAPEIILALPDIPFNPDKVISLRVGQTMALDHLGPVIINSDGTTSRITNWDSLTPEEQERTLRRVAARNQARRAELEAKMV